MSSKQEKEMVNAINSKRAVEKKVEREFKLFEQMLPAIRAAVRAGGGAEAVLRKSETIAAYELLKATQSDKDEVRVRAATEILNRTMGKPVERSISVYGDLNKMSEQDVDSQIMRLLEQTGSHKLIETTLEIPTRKIIKQKRKPRKSDALVIKAKGPIAGTEEGTPSEPEDQGTPS